MVRAAADGVDWTRFLRVLARQRVPGLARDALKSAGVAAPPEVEQRLAALAQAGAARGLALAAEAVRLQAPAAAPRACRRCSSRARRSPSWPTARRR